MSDDANEELVRKLLQLNPHLRGDGQSTKDVLEAVQKGVAAPRAPAKAAEVNVSAELARIKREHEAASAALDTRQRDAAARRKSVAEQRLVDKKEALALLIEVVLRDDPNMTKSASVLRAEKAFVDAIGFSAQKVVEAERHRKRE